MTYRAHISRVFAAEKTFAERKICQLQLTVIMKSLAFLYY